MILHLLGAIVAGLICALVMQLATFPMLAEYQVYAREDEKAEALRAYNCIALVTAIIGFALGFALALFN